MNTQSASLDVIGGIARAIITASDQPLLLLSEDLVILAASRSFCRTFGIETADGLQLKDLGKGEWRVPQLDALLLAAASSPLAVDDYGMDLTLAGRAVINLKVSVNRLEPTVGQPLMLLVSIQDVTEKQKRDLLNDKLVREKTVMLAELQHRVANSLQIIASVLLQSARRLQSGGSRSQIVDAHNRVMSVAALQHQLAVSADEEVDLSIYFANLCRSIGASMIEDTDKIRIETDVDDSCIASSVSLSLGLIVTELLINCLKHAYPDEGSGVITVKFRSNAGGWTLKIRDDGIGMPAATADVTAGLGTSIVKALSTQIDAVISITSTNPGTQVEITHLDAVAARLEPKALPV